MTIVTEPVISSAAQDRLWISQTLAGHPRAYSYLIDKYKDQLFGLVCRMLKDRSQGEDILQDAFVRTYEHLKSFRYESKFSTWIYAIVLNRVRNQLRRNKVVHWSSLDAPLEGETNIYLPEIRHKEPSMDMVVERKMDIETIQHIVLSFPLHYQSIFIMHYFQNLSLQEVADRMDRPVGTVKVYLHRARKMLYKRLYKTKTASLPALLFSAA